MIFGMSLYQFFMYFLIYSLIGWVIEVIYHAVTMGVVINRGFLCGPVCPVYGFGMVAVLSVLNTISDILHAQANAFIVFLSSMFLATLVELIAGWALDRIFHMRWWDYSDMPFNLNGYICLKFSIYWGLGGMIAIRIVHPAIAQMTVQRIPEKIGIPAMIILYLIYMVDFFVTAVAVAGLNKRLKEIDEIRSALHVPSDRMTEKIAGNTLRAAAVIGHTRVQAALAEAELKEQFQEKRNEIRQKGKEKREEFLEKNTELLEMQAELKEKAAAGEKRLLELAAKITEKNVISRRMLKAFPNMRHRQYTEILKELKRKAKSKKDSAEGKDM